MSRTARTTYGVVSLVFMAIFLTMLFIAPPITDNSAAVIFFGYSAAMATRLVLFGIPAILFAGLGLATLIPMITKTGGKIRLSAEAGNETTAEQVNAATQEVHQDRERVGATAFSCPSCGGIVEFSPHRTEIACSVVPEHRWESARDFYFALANVGLQDQADRVSALWYQYNQPEG